MDERTNGLAVDLQKCQETKLKYLVLVVDMSLRRRSQIVKALFLVASVTFFYRILELRPFITFEGKTFALDSSNSSENLNEVESQLPIRSSSPLPTPSPIDANEKKPTNSNKFLQYFVSGGWGNQVACLESANAIAWATNRTLILSPLIPHRVLHYNMVFDVKRTRTFHLAADLLSLYQESYPRLDHVLDVDFLSPQVPTVDFRDFYQQVYPTLQNPNTWVMETNYSHLNTRWVVRQPELVGNLETIEAIEYNIDVRYTIQTRDLEAVGYEFQDYDIWTLLDSYRGTKYSQLPVTFRPRLSRWIRETSRQLLAEHDFHIFPYASVHIRGSDGPFKKPEAIRNAISQSLDQISTTFVRWISASATTTATSTNHTKIGLFVATDIKKLEANPIFIEKIAALRQILQNHSSTQLKILLGRDLAPRVEELSKNDRSFPFGELVTPSLFLDQQAAACATIDFVGTQKSTFSAFIGRLRQDQLNACR